MTTAVRELIAGWRTGTERERVLRVVQPGLIGLIDGTLSTLAPIFAAAYLAGSRTALLVGLATAFGAGISMGVSEGLLAALFGAALGAAPAAGAADDDGAPPSGTPPTHGVPPGTASKTCAALVV